MAGCYPLGVTLGKTIPILRIFDETKARELYVGFLGFKIDWEHRFSPDVPLYMQVSRDGSVLHLSEHYRDGSPGAAIRIDIRPQRLSRRATAKQYKYARRESTSSRGGGRSG